LRTSRGRTALLDEYGRLASRYDRRWRRYVEASTRETLNRIPIAPGARILDVGCGTGALLAAMAATCPAATLCGLDPVAAMLDRARQRLPATVALQRGWGERLPFAGGVFDVVTSNSAFHYVPAPERALAEMHRVLRPQGVLVVTDWCGDFLFSRLIDRYLSALGRAHHRVYRGDEFLDLVAGAGFVGAAIHRFRAGPWGLMTVSATSGPTAGPLA